MAGNTVLTSTDNGRTVELGVGDTIDLALAENPTTGFRWELAALEGGALALAGDRFDPGSGGGIGGGGTRHFALVARKAGQTALSAALQRAWARDQPPLETFSATVKVSA